MHVAVAHDAAHVQHLRERESGRREGEPRSSHRVACRARDALIAASEAAREKSMAFDFAERFRRTLPTLTTVASASSEIATVGARFARPLARSFVHSRLVLFRSPTLVSGSRLSSARLGSGSLGLAWIGFGLARPTTRSYAPARGDSSARERSPSESHACQRRPAQIMVGCVERRGGGCGDCGYETRGRRRSFLLAYVVSSLSLPFTRSIPLPRSPARSLALRPRLVRLTAAIAVKTFERAVS